MTKSLTVFDLIALGGANLQLNCLAGRGGLVSLISSAERSRPGLALAGFSSNFTYNYIQLFGNEELAFLAHLKQEGGGQVIENFLKFKPPCIIFTNNLNPDAHFLALADSYEVAVLQSPCPTTKFYEHIFHLLSPIFAQTITVHGVLVEVYGLGLLLMGDSGVGKSETALDLIERGHRLVSDDAVTIQNISGNELVGITPLNSRYKHFMEIRGLGLIDITTLYGLRSVRDSKQIDMVIKLEEWQEGKEYDRAGVEESFYLLLGFNVPCITLPIKPGRNLPVIIETAALKRRSGLKQKVI
jgi:HPr kinase/phosphorylase